MKRIFLLGLVALLSANMVCARSMQLVEPAADDETIYVTVENLPEFPGGQQALFSYLKENVKYPTIAKENGIQGRVVCTFVVEKDGRITNVEVVRSGGDPSLDKEAVRVIKSMPKWKPGMQRGQAVRVKFTIPVKFSLPKEAQKDK